MFKIGTKLQGNTGLFNAKDYGAIISRVIAERSRASVLGSCRGLSLNPGKGWQTKLKSGLQHVTINVTDKSQKGVRLR